MPLSGRRLFGASHDEGAQLRVGLKELPSANPDEGKTKHIAQWTASHGSVGLLGRVSSRETRACAAVRQADNMSADACHLRGTDGMSYREGQHQTAREGCEAHKLRGGSRGATQDCPTSLRDHYPNACLRRMIPVIPTSTRDSGTAQSAIPESMRIVSVRAVTVARELVTSGPAVSLMRKRS